MGPPTPQRGAIGAGWFTPIRLLCIFCAMNLMIYVDRGVIASNGVNGSPQTAEKEGYGIQGDFGLSLFQDGLLPAAFMVGLLASSPVFAEASKRFNAFRLIGTGLGVWTLAAAGCGLSLGFVSLLLCRMAVGVGEASFVALASPFIDDNAPPERKTRWLATFYLCIPTGYAVGYIYGGLVASAIGWRAAFLIEAAIMLPFVIFCLRAPAIDIRGTHDPPPKLQPQQDTAGAGGAEGGLAWPARGRMGEEGGLLLEGHGPSSSSSAHAVAAEGGGGEHEHGGHHPGLAAGLMTFKADIASLCAHPIYVLSVGGMTCYTAVIGTFAFYGPKAGRDVFDFPPEGADLAFGAITVLTGVFGTLAGGFLLDFTGSSLRNALLVCALGTALGCLFIVLGFVLASSFAVFSVALAAGQFAMFMTQAPSNALCMWAIPPGLRPLAMSMAVVVMHLLGDVPGPPLLGLLQGRLRNWRLSMSLCSALLLVGAALYACALRALRTAVDYRTLVPVGEEEEEEGEQRGLRGEGQGEGGEGGAAGGMEGHSSSGWVQRAAAGEASASEEDVSGQGYQNGVWESSSRASPELPLLVASLPGSAPFAGPKAD